MRKNLYLLIACLMILAGPLTGQHTGFVLSQLIPFPPANHSDSVCASAFAENIVEGKIPYRTYHYYYNLEGRLSEEIQRNSGKKIQQRYIYSYDGKGNLVRQVEHRPEKPDYLTNTYSYQYDSLGRVLRKSHIRATSPEGTTKRQIDSIFSHDAQNSVYILNRYFNGVKWTDFDTVINRTEKIPQENGYMLYSYSFRGMDTIYIDREYHSSGRKTLNEWVWYGPMGKTKKEEKRLKKGKDRKWRSMKYSYPETDSTRSQVIRGKEEVRTITRDTAGRVIRFQWKDRGIWFGYSGYIETCEYDSQGRPVLIEKWPIFGFPRRNRVRKMPYENRSRLEITWY